MLRRYLALTCCATLLASCVVIAKSPTGTIALNQSSPQFGTYITFTWTCDGCPSNQKEAPRIQVLCYQVGYLVYGTAGPADGAFLLGGSMSQWVLNGGGAATCHADLYYWSYQGSQQFNELAGVDFNVAP